MALTVTYNYVNAIISFFLNNVITAGQQSNVDVAGLANGSYFAAWNDAIPGQAIRGRTIASYGTPAQNEFLVNSTTANAQRDAAITGFGNNFAVVAFEDYSVDTGGDIRARIFNTNGTAVAADFAVSTSSNDDVRPDVAALNDGGFVVSWTRNFGNSDYDIDGAIYNQNGTLRTNFFVDGSTTFDDDNSAVAGLTGGGFVVAYREQAVGGGNDSVLFQRYTNGGVTQGGHIVIDNIGSINDDIQIHGLLDGGFVVSYTDNGWALSGTEITARVYNADGSARTSYIRVNDNTTGDQAYSSITTLSNGFFTVGWKDQSDQTYHYHTYTSQGISAGADFNASGSVVDGEIAGLTGGLIAQVRSSSINDAGGDQSVRTQVDDFQRTITSDGAGDALIGDSLIDHLIGNGGADTLIGNGGADIMEGGQGDDVYGVENIGDVVTELVGQGFDTVYSSVSYTLTANTEALFLQESAGAINGTGNALGNALIGNSFANVLTGGAGDDVYGVNGNIDTVVELANGGYDEVYSSANFSMPEYVETLFLTGTAITANGNSGNNAIIGNDQNNIIQTGDGTFEFINGGAGNDTLIGGHGHDEIFGGTGADFFRLTEVADSFSGASNDGDLFLDFTPGEDKIQLNAANFGMNQANAGGNYFDGPSPAAHFAVPTLLYNSSNGVLFLDPDGTGPNGLVILATLSGAPALHASDFTFY